MLANLFEVVNLNIKTNYQHYSKSFTQRISLSLKPGIHNTILVIYFSLEYQQNLPGLIWITIHFLPNRKPFIFLIEVINMLAMKNFEHTKVRHNSSIRIFSLSIMKYTLFVFLKQGLAVQFRLLLGSLCSPCWSNLTAISMPQPNSAILI